MKSRNYAVLLVVVVICALAARFLLQPGAMTLQSDLKVSLDRFWGNDKSEVDVSPAGDVGVRVWIPSSTRQRQREWTVAVARFIVLRHPQEKIQNLSLTDLTTGQPVLESESPESNTKQAESAAPRPPGFTDPAAFEAARSQLLQRNGQIQLDRQLGAGRALLLVDVTSLAVSWLPNVPRNLEQSSITYGRRAGPKHEARVGLVPRAESREAVQRRDVSVAKIEACLIIQSEAEADKAKQAIGLELDEARGDRLRILLL
jgi:hypothetical protein